MKLEEILNIYSVETIKTIPTRICETIIVNLDEYNSSLNSDKEYQKKIDDEILQFKKSKDYIGFYKKNGYRIYVRSINYSKKFCEKKMIEFLKGK